MWNFENNLHIPVGKLTFLSIEKISMDSWQIILKLLFILLLAIFSTSCTTFHKIEGVSDFSPVELQKDDVVKIVTKSDEKYELTIIKTDADHIYGKNSVIKKEDIKSMELSRFNPGKIYFSIMGLLLLSMLFSG